MQNMHEAMKRRTMKPATRTVECKPTWEATAHMLIRLLTNGSADSQKFAQDEIVRMGQIIDRQTKVAA